MGPVMEKGPRSVVTIISLSKCNCKISLSERDSLVTSPHPNISFFDHVMSFPNRLLAAFSGHQAPIHAITFSAGLGQYV